MPITVQWYDDNKNIAVTRFDGDWTLEDFHQMMTDSAQITGSKQEAFITIADFSNSITPPRKTLTIGQRVNTAHNPNRILLIFVKSGMLIEILYNTLGKLYPKSFGQARTVDTFDEAIEIAHETLSHHATQAD